MAENSPTFTRMMRHIPFDGCRLTETYWRERLQSSLAHHLSRDVARLAFGFLESLLAGMTRTEMRIVDWLFHHMKRCKQKPLVAQNWNRYERFYCYKVCKMLGLRFEKSIEHRPRDMWLGYKRVTIHLS